MRATLGSLFDGSGGFPLAGSMCGITPLWASEIEPYPIAVTRSRFPDMKHLGDISKVNGADIEPVDIITFGSPCQDLSIAGKRAGLKHQGHGDEQTTRSGLFMEAIRIIREMRCATNGKYPRFAIWENVPGAFSSGTPKGEDFRIVLEELIKISEKKASMPPTPKGGWPYADAYVGDRWSLAYRTFDAQYWGVPQRRRRIYLIADFVGGCAPRILFEREGLRGYFAKGKSPWKRITADAQGSIRTDDNKNETVETSDCITLASVASTLRTHTGGPKNFSDCVGRFVLKPFHEANGIDGYNGVLTGQLSSTLGVNCGVSTGRNGVLALSGGDMKAEQSEVYCMASGQAHAEIYENKCPTLNCTAENPIVAELAQTQYTPMVLFEPRSHDGIPRIHTEVSPTLNTAQGGQRQPCVALPVYCVQGNCIDRTDTAGCNGKGWTENASFTLNTIDRPAVSYAMTTGSFMQVNKETSPTLAARDYKDAPLVYFGDDAQIYGQNSYAGYAEGIGGTLKASGGSYGGGSESLIVEHKPCYIVRRLTPTECARLQGFADDWGVPIHKNDFTNEEYRFWLDVRNTHAAINGRNKKEYTKAQMLAWYNKLHSKASEYKMWGNGVAMPPTLYCMQGISEELSTVHHKEAKHPH